MFGFGWIRNRDASRNSSGGSPPKQPPVEVERPVRPPAPISGRTNHDGEPPLPGEDNNRQKRVTDTHEVASLVEQIVEQLVSHIDRLVGSLQNRLDEHVHENQSAIRKRIDTRTDKIALDLARRLDGQAHDLRQLLKRVLGPLAVQITETITKQGDEHWLVLKEEMKEASSTTPRRAAQRPIIDRLLALLDRIRSEGAFLNAWYRRDPDLALHLGCRQLHERYEGAVCSFAAETLMILQGLGVEPIEGCAGAFNPKFQQVVSVEMTSKSELDGHVARIVRAGFTWNGTILRPEQVVVFKKQERNNHEEKKWQSRRRYRSRNHEQRRGDLRVRWQLQDRPQRRR